MSDKPRDVADLHLAPLALELDSRLERLGQLDPPAIGFEISLVTNREPQTFEQRSRLALEALTRNADLHGWQVDWDARGVRLTHGNHSIVLGLPANLRTYLHT
jgi:hypothetical protein